MSDPISTIPFLGKPLPDVITGGQPNGAQFEALAKAGYKTVVNTRAHGEPLTDQEPQFVEQLGMRYVHIPISGGGDLSVDNAKRLAEALDGGLPALVHCASSNRVGALFALKAFHLDGQSADDALALGRAAGLTRMEPIVRGLLK